MLILIFIFGKKVQSKGDQFVKYDRSCTNFEKVIYTRVYTTTGTRAHKPCESTGKTYLNGINTASECLQQCSGDYKDTCIGFTFYTELSVDQNIRCTLAEDQFSEDGGNTDNNHGVCYKPVDGA